MLIKSPGLEVAFSHKADNNTASQLPKRVVKHGADIFTGYPVPSTAGDVHVNAGPVVAVKHHASNDPVASQHPETLRTMAILTPAMPLEIIAEDRIPVRTADDFISHIPSRR